MATQEKTWNVANRLHSLKDSDNPEVNHIIAGADEIYDDAKSAKQSDINTQTGAALANRYTKAETYSKEQLNSLITTPDVNYVTVATFADLPQTGESDTVYRVSSYDGTQVDITKYALYAWDGTTYQLLAVRSAIGEVVDVSEINSGATYADLPAALADVPDSVKRGGMSIKFIQRTNTGTEDEPVYNDEYVQYRYMGTSIATADFTNTANWQGIDDEPTPGSRNLVESGGVVNAIDDAVAFRFFASPYSEADVLSYVVDQNNKVFATINKDGSITKKVLNQREKADRQLLLMLDEQVAGINNQLTEYSLEEMDALLKQVSSPFDDGEADVLKYLTDEEDRIFGVVKKDGTVYFYKLDAKNVDFDLLKMVSGEMSQDNPQVLKYLTDENDRCFGYIKKDGTVFFYKFESQEFDNSLLKMLSSDAPYKDENVLKYLTDEDGRCFGYLKKDGTIVIHKAEIKELKTDEESGHSASEAQMATVLGLIATGVDNIEMSNNPKTMAVLNNLFTEKSVIINANNSNNKNLHPCFSLIDDDTVDNQIPDSQGASEPTEKTGGYFSVLLPLTLSLKAKHGKPVPVGLACEGHRIGLTSFKAFNDDYNKTLNVNGHSVKWLADNIGWDILNHSMTAQLPEDHVFVVDSINSELADTIRINGEYHGTLNFHNTAVLESSTGKWYEVNSNKTAWIERTPTKKYAYPFYQDYNTKKWYFNRAFDFEYSWGEWFKRAEECGLPVKRIIVHNGSTSSVFMAYAARKYAYFTVRTSGVYNNPPIPATVSRTSSVPSSGAQGYNVWHDNWVTSKLDIIDNCIANKSWVVFMSHFNDQGYHRNYYLDNREYPAAEEGQPALRGKDDNYSEEWIIPLKNEEIMDIIGDNVHDYINNPPSRLGISSWSEWYPCPGTQLAAFYYILDIAMSKGIDIVTPWDGWQTHGNILNIGIDRNGQSYTYDSAANQTPYTDEEKSYLTIGADMSIRYYNSKQN